jgi:KUP system potassium uptake protein
VSPGLDVFVLPFSVAILVGLFVVQRTGSGRIGRLFGPVMLLWLMVPGSGAAGRARHTHGAGGACSV